MSLLSCQLDAYLTQTDAAVLDTRAHPDGVEVRLGATLLYPEGGGQPDDHGSVAGRPVRALRKDADGVVWHLLDDAPAQETVTVTVDWGRRFDHMQQHTAQHLISAIAADRFGALTTAFHLRPGVCDIDLSRGLSAKELRALESAVNTAIRDNLAVRAQVSSVEALDAVRTRGLPAGFSGDVRLVEIDGLDLNTCGGTHVASLGELQAVSLMPLQKNKGGAKLRYLAGGRLLSRLAETYAREHTISKLLSSGLSEHAEGIRRLQQGAKDAARSQKALLGELASFIGGDLARQARPHLHREEADMNFLRAAATAATSAAPERTFLLTGGGMFMVAGPEAAVKALGPQVAALLGGRGGGARGRFQGRVGSLDQIEAAVAMISA